MFAMIKVVQHVHDVKLVVGVETVDVRKDFNLVQALVEEVLVILLMEHVAMADVNSSGSTGALRERAVSRMRVSTIVRVVADLDYLHADELIQPHVECLDRYAERSAADESDDLISLRNHLVDFGRNVLLLLEARPAAAMDDCEWNMNVFR